VHFEAGRWFYCVIVVVYVYKPELGAVARRARLGSRASQDRHEALEPRASSYPTKRLNSCWWRHHSLFKGSPKSSLKSGRVCVCVCVCRGLSDVVTSRCFTAAGLIWGGLSVFTCVITLRVLSVRSGVKAGEEDQTHVIKGVPLSRDPVGVQPKYSWV